MMTKRIVQKRARQSQNKRVSANESNIARLYMRLRAKGTLALRMVMRRALLLLLLASVALGGIAPAGLAHAAVQAAASAAAGEAVEQPQSWLLKWRDPALAHELRGTEVLRRQNEAAVMLVRPADAGADVQEWLRRLQGMPGVGMCTRTIRCTSCLCLPARRMTPLQRKPLRVAVRRSQRRRLPYGGSPA